MTPKEICMSPESKKIVRIEGNAFETSPSLIAINPPITTILTAVIGAVGPEIWVSVPPKKAAKKLTKIAPYRPALGPNPELTPNASAKGRATIPAVSPPKKSPLKFEKSNLNFFIKYRIVIFVFRDLEKEMMNDVNLFLILHL